MCVLSSQTCGACLAKWNGQSWKETYEGILPLKMWTLVLNESCELCVEGHYEDLGFVINICIPLKKRVNSRWVANERTLIKLQGPLFSKDLPDFVVNRFSNGIPENWKYVAQKWVNSIDREGVSFSSLNETLTSNTSRGSRNRRNLGILNKVGRGELQRRTPAAVTTKQRSCDSAFQSLQSSSAVATNRGSNTGSNWISPSPWLPPHKVKEITQWMNRSPVTPHIPTDPPTGLESEPGDGGSIVDLHVGGLPSGGACTTVSSSSNRLSAASRLRQLSGSLAAESNQHRNNALTQSTPLTGTQDIRPSANPLNISMTMSSISHMDLSSGMSSFESIVPQDNLFRKPMQDTHGMETPANSTRLLSKPTLSSKSVNQRGSIVSSGAGIGTMEKSPRSRPIRKHTPQKIERWRPILGVDGNVKLQGYLVLRGDMTAGQILTTNSIVVWSGPKVTTCDQREYELIGDVHDPPGKVPVPLRRKLKKPMKVSDIQEALQNSQALRDRSDWGAEYDIFYHNSTNPEISAKTPRSSSRRSNKSSSSNNNNNKVSEPPSSASTARRTSSRPHLPPPPPRGSERRADGDEDGGAPSPSRKSLRLCSNNNNSKADQSKRSENNNLLQSGSPKTDYVMHVSPSRIKVSYPSKTSPTPVTPNSNSNDASVRCRPQNDASTAATASRARTPRCPAKLSCDTCCGSPATPVTSRPPRSRPRPSNRIYEDENEDDDDANQQEHQQKTTTMTTSTPTPPRNTTRRKTTTKMKKQNNTSSGVASSPKKRTSAPAPVERNLRGSLGKTRLQTLSKSPRVLISPLDRRHYRLSQKRRAWAQASPSATTSSVQRRTTLSPRKLFKPSPSVLNTTNTRRKLRSTQKATTEDESASVASTATVNEKEKTTRVSRGKREAAFSRKADDNEEEEEATTKKTALSNKKRSNSNQSKNQRASSKNENRKQKPTGKRKDEQEEEEAEQHKENVKFGKQTATKRKTEKPKTTGQKERGAILPSPEMVDISQMSEDKEDDASVCSNSSDISIGPSASVVFALNAAATEAAGEEVEEGGRQRAPRTLRERRTRDAALQRMANLVEKMAEAKAAVAAERGGAGDDDDPVTQLINSHPFQPLPQEWCDHRTWMRGQGGRKRRRPSSSDGTASPSRCSALSYGGHDDATSSVATPQLLMRRPDPKQVQSYLQRLRALKSKPHRPTRKVRADRQLNLPDIDYSQAFQNESSSESGSESPVDSDWEG